MGDSARHPIRTAHGCVWWRPIAVLVIFTALAACDDSEKRVVEQVNRAVQELNNQNFSNARHHLNQAREIGEVGSSDPDVNYYLGFLALRSEDAKAAAGYLKVAVQGDPPRPEAHLDLARAHEAMGKYRNALTALEGLFALDPGHPNGHLLAARLARRSKDRSTENRALRAAIAGDPGFAPAYLMLSRLYNKVGAHKESLEVLNEGLRFSPGDLALQEELGLAWMELGYPDRATDVFAAAAGRAGAAYSLHYNYAAALLQMGEKVKAMDQLRRYILVGRGRAKGAELETAARMILKLRKP